MLSFAAICPHPPLLIPSIGEKDVLKVQNTADAMLRLSHEMCEKNIDTILVISPHGQVFMDYMSVNLAERLCGDFYDFGSNVSMDFRNDADLAIYLKGLADSIKFPLLTVSERLDHGAMVPLYFIARKLPNIQVCHVSFSYLDYGKHFTFGEIIYEAVQSSERKVAVIASGDLSHRLTAATPAGYSTKGKVFDNLLISCLEENRMEDIINMDSRLIELAGECGLRSIIILLGALSNMDYKFEKLSYEGPFGVGYLVGEFNF